MKTKQQPKKPVPSKKKWDFLNFIESNLDSTHHTACTTKKAKTPTNVQKPCKNKVEAALMIAISNASIINHSAYTSLKSSPINQSLVYPITTTAKNCIAGKQKQRASQNVVNNSVTYKSSVAMSRKSSINPKESRTAIKSTLCSKKEANSIIAAKESTLQGLIHKAIVDRETRKTTKNFNTSFSHSRQSSNSKSNSKIPKENRIPATTQKQRQTQIVTQKPIANALLHQRHQSLSSQIENAISENAICLEKVEKREYDKEFINKYTRINAKDICIMINRE